MTTERAHRHPNLQALVASLEQDNATLEASEIPALIGELERVKTVLWLRLAAPARDTDARTSAAFDDLRHITPA